MGVYDRLIGIEAETGARVSDRINPEVFAALLAEYERGRLLRGFLRPERDGAGQQTAQGATTVFSPVLVPVGRLAVLVVHSDASKTITSVADSGSNTWMIDLTGNGDTGTNFLSIASSQITTELAQTSDITITWSDATSSTVERILFEITGAVTSSAFDQGAVVYQATEAMSIATPALLGANSEAVLALFRTNAGSGTFALEQAPANTLLGITAVVATDLFASVYARDQVTMSGLWSVAGDGVAAIATYKGLPGDFLPDLVERELSSPLTYHERELLNDFCTEIDNEAAPFDYVAELREVLMLTHRETPGYRDQLTVGNMLGVM